MTQKKAPAKADVYSDFPSTADALATRVEREGMLLRLRQIARLELQGLQAPEIALELSKGSSTWNLEMVLHLMGGGSEGTANEREQLRRQYELVKEEARHPELLDVDQELKESQARALSIMREAMETAENPKDRAMIAKELLKIGGIGADKLERKIVEIRMAPEAVESLRALVNWRAPKNKLGELIEVKQLDSGN